MAMTVSDTTSRGSVASYGGFVDAIGGVATIVLAIVGLAGIRPDMMLAIATIVFGVALLVEGGSIMSEYANIIFPSGARSAAVENFGGAGLSAHFLVGAAGIVLGILAVAGMNSVVLVFAALIALGATLVMSGSSLSATVASFMRPADQR
jgi:hypothetical protein